MMWFSKEPWSKKRRRIIYQSNLEDSEWSILHWNWGPWFYSSGIALPHCGYYCSQWKLLAFFHQSIRLKCITGILFVSIRGMLTGPNMSWPNISPVPADSNSKIVLTKQMDYGTPWEKSRQFVNLTSCRLQNHDQMVYHFSTGHLFWISQGFFR